MPAQTKKTDNDFLADKVQLRVDHCPRPIGRPARVLDCYGGKGVVWRLVEAKTSVKVERVAIDSRTDLSDFHLHGDNIKVMAGMDLTGFDVIDLDAYGIPAAQLVEVFESGFTGVVFATAIQTMQGGIPRIILDDLGFPDAVSKKAPSLPSRRGWQLIKEWLAHKGVTQIHHRSKGRKHYLCFRISGAAGDGAGCDSRPADISASHA